LAFFYLIELFKQNIACISAISMMVLSRTGCVHISTGCVHVWL